MNDLYIDFKSVGWDWIIYPPQYNAKYCSGDCAHISVRNTLRGKLVGWAADNLTREASKSCCAAEKMSAISVLYYDDLSNIVFTNVEGMSIKACHCV